MGKIKDNITVALTDSSIFATLSVTRITEGEIDYTGTPDTNEDYGTYAGESTESLDIDMCVQYISSNDIKNGNYIDYEKRGYTIKGSLKVKSLITLTKKDIINHPDGFEYEVVELENRYYPDDNGTLEYVYTNAFAVKKELEET